MDIPRSKQSRTPKIAGIALSVIVVAATLFGLKSSYFCSKAVAFCFHASQQHTATQISPQYFTYSDELLAESLKTGKRVVLYFYAPWCTTCTGFDQELREKHSQLPPNVIVLQIQYDQSLDLRSQYNVSYQHTLILLDEKGQTKEMWIGGDFASVLQYLTR